MKRYIIVLSLLLIHSFATSQLNVITYNIRYNNPGDGQHAWPNRKADVINLLKFHRADIFGLQEALHEQVLDIASAFPNYSYVGVGRDDGIQKGEYSPIFYNTQLFREKSKGHFWLSENPSKPALGWDAACIRICTWVELEDIESGKSFMVFNTHFDHVGVLARENAATLILKKIESLAKGKPVILSGDFNLPPDSKPIGIISSKLEDSFRITELPPHGSYGTWTGFRYEDEKGDRIDYIFVSKGIRVLRYAGLTDSRDGSFFSDHLPVMAELLLPL